MSMDNELQKHYALLLGTVPWAAPQGRFTLHFERFAIEVLLACANVQAGCELLGIGWETVHEIMKRAVARGLERRQLDQLKHLGMDEKSFKRGHSYITLLTDLEQSRVLEVVEDRTTEAAEQLWDSLGQEPGRWTGQYRKRPRRWRGRSNTYARSWPGCRCSGTY